MLKKGNNPECTRDDYNYVKKRYRRKRAVSKYKKPAICCYTKVVRPKEVVVFLPSVM